MRVLFAAVSASVLLAGCAGMSKSECLHADWRAIGYEDGARGAPATALSPRRQACANKAGVTPDMTAYLEGRTLGLGQFCTPANGFVFGERGGTYSGVCADHGEAAFLAEYRAGAHLNALRSHVDHAARALAEAEQDLEDIRYDITHAEAALVAPETTVEDRVAYLADLKRLSEARGRIEYALPDLLLALDEARSDLAAYEWTLATDLRKGVSTASYTPVAR